MNKKSIYFSFLFLLVLALLPLSSELFAARGGGRGGGDYGRGGGVDRSYTRDRGLRNWNENRRDYDYDRGDLNRNYYYNGGYYYNSGTPNYTDPYYNNPNYYYYNQDYMGY